MSVIDEMIDEMDSESLRTEVQRLREALEMVAPKPPKAFKNALGPFEMLLYDKGARRPIGWGFKILRKLEDDEAAAMKTHGDIEFLHSQTEEGENEYGLIVRWLTPAEAEAKYGKPSKPEYGPRGGFRQVFYGTTPFNHRRMDPGKADK